VLSKPVGKTTFLLAKFAGTAMLLLLFCAAMAAATLMSVRTVTDPFTFDWLGSGPLLAAPVVAAAAAGLQNYFLRTPFVSRAFGYLMLALACAFLASAALGGDKGFGGRLDARILPASLLVTMAILVLAALAVSLAARMDIVATLSVCSAVFMAGLMSDYFVGRVGPGRRWASFLLDLLPNWQHFWAVDALSGDGIPWSYVAAAGRYAALCLAGILAAVYWSSARWKFADGRLSRTSTSLFRPPRRRRAGARREPRPPHGAAVARPPAGLPRLRRPALRRGLGAGEAGAARRGRAAGRRARARRAARCLDLRPR